jgi:hypothetical protein
MENPGRRQPVQNLSVNSNIFFQNSLAASAPKRIAMLLRRPHPASASF